MDFDEGRHPRDDTGRFTASAGAIKRLAVPHAERMTRMMAAWNRQGGPHEYKGARTFFGGKVYAELQPRGGKMVLNNIATRPDARGHGLAAGVLKRLTKLADRHGVTMKLTTLPFGEAKDAGLKAKALRGFYGRHGFRTTWTSSDRDTFEMERKPK